MVTLRRFQRLLPSGVLELLWASPPFVQFLHIEFKIRKKRRIQKENPKSKCLIVTQLRALASWHVHVWRTMVTGSPSYATRSVTLTIVVSTGVTGDIHWCEQSTIYLFWQIACGRPPAGRRTGKVSKQPRKGRWVDDLLFCYFVSWTKLNACFIIYHSVKLLHDFLFYLTFHFMIVWVDLL